MLDRRSTDQIRSTRRGRVLRASLAALLGIFSVTSFLPERALAARLVPVGDEFTIRADDETKTHRAPTVATEPGGGFVVIWHRNDDGDRSNRAQRFDGDGNFVGSGFEIGDAYRYPRTPSVAIDRNRDFLVAWSEGLSVYARAGSLDGQTTGATFRVGGPGNSSQLDYGDTSRMPTVVATEPGRFVVAWSQYYVGYPAAYLTTTTSTTSTTTTTTMGHILERSFPRHQESPSESDVSLTRLLVEDGEIVASSRVKLAWDSEYGRVADEFDDPRVALIGPGRIAAVWGRQGTLGTSIREVPEFERDGVLDLSLFEGGGYGLDLASGLHGDLVLAIEDSREGFLLAAFDRQARPLSTALVLDLSSDDFAYGIDIAKSAAGDTVAAWALYPGFSSVPADGDGLSIAARAFDCRLQSSAGEVVVNQAGAGDQGAPAVAVSESGTVMVVWETTGSSAEQRGVFGRLFRLTGGCSLCGDPSGDERITATDALMLLKMAVGGMQACPPEVCDVDDNGLVAASDALQVLIWSTGQPRQLRCPL